jgi:hypothetical protein
LSTMSTAATASPATNVMMGPLCFIAVSASSLSLGDRCLWGIGVFV